MKKAITAMFALTVGMSLFPSAGAAPAKQVEEGSIILPAPFFGDLNSCYSGLHRRINVVGMENINGVVGYHFDIDKTTWGGKFKLEVTNGVGDPDLDITFYPEFGTLEQATDVGYAPPTVSYEEREPGGEKGVVPPEMNKAIICMWAGEAHQGGVADFTYEASPPKKKKKKSRK